VAKKIEAFKLSGRVEVDASKAKGELKNVSNEAQSAAKAVKGVDGALSGGGFKSKARDLFGSLGNVSEILTAIPIVGGAIKSAVGAVTGPMADLAQRGLEFDDIVETAMIGFSTMLKSEDEAKKHLESLKKFAATTPFEFRDLIGYSQELQGMGFQAKEIVPTLTAVGDALSAMGRTDHIESVIEALGKMKAMGRVSGEEIRRIAETGIPVYKILADAVGLTTKQVQKLAEENKLNADEAINILTQELESKYKGSMDKISKNTRQGALSNFEDNLDRLAGQAVQNVHDGMTEALNTVNDGFDKGLGTGLAATLGRAGGAVSNVFNTALKGILGGDFLTKMKDAAGNIVNTASDTIVNNTPTFIRSLSDMAVSGYDSFAKEWGIQSPSRKMIEAGGYIAEGLRIGLTRSQARMYAAMRQLFDADPAFLDKLITESIKRGINPDHILNAIAAESGFNKAAQNGFGYSGLIQFGDDERRQVGMPRETWGEGGRAAAKEFLSSISASEQLDYVFRYLDQRAHGRKLDTQAKVYETIGAGSVKGGPDAVRFAAGSRGARNNPLWDFNGDGTIQNWEFGPAAEKKLGAGVRFTVNGTEVSNSNPMPVAVVEYKMAARDPFADAPAGGRHTRSNPMPVQIVGAGGDLTGGVGELAGGPPRLNPRLEIPDLNMDVVPVVTAQMSQLLDTTKGVVVAVDAVDGALADAEKKTDNSVKARRARLLHIDKAAGEDFAKIWGDLATGFEGVLNSALTNTEGSFKDWTVNLAASFFTMLQQMSAQLIASAVMKFLFNPAEAGMSGTGTSGFLGSLLGSLSGLFGGKRASGGDVERGRAYLIGEKGPEIFTPGATGFITPNHVAFGGDGAGGAGGAPAQNINLRNVILFDPTHVTNAMRSSEGERVTMAHIDRNITQIAEKIQRFTS
jgi:tape measure domain-containing protein